MTKHHQYFHGSKPAFERIRTGHTRLWITHPGQFHYPVSEGDTLVLTYRLTWQSDPPAVSCKIEGLVMFWTPEGRCLPSIGLKIEVPANRRRP